MKSIIIILLESLVVLIGVLVSIAYLTIVERKLMASIQRRIGPSNVGFFGTLQPFAVALKLFTKEIILPLKSTRNFFLGAPVVTLTLSFISWSIIPFNNGIVISDFNLGILFILAVSSLGIYGVVFSGWAAGSKYSLMGSLRSTAQMISYEVALSFLIICVTILTNSLNLTQISESQASVYFCIPLFPIFIMFLVSMLAETNRAPFDLPEAESELVSGFFTEHSAFPFAFFFLGEYGNMILISVVCSFLFLGGYHGFFPFSLIPGFSLGIKVIFILAFFVWVRATFPRYRYDLLISLMWKSFLPLCVGFTLLIPSLILIL